MGTNEPPGSPQSIVWLVEEAYHAIAHEYRECPEAFEKPHKAIFDLAGIYEWNQDFWLATFLRAFGLHVERGLKMKDIRDIMIGRANEGHSWRAVILWKYKANRSRCPRVTNRGAAATRLANQQEG